MFLVILDLKHEILEEAHSSAYAMHPGSTKMYRTIRENYWWPNMKREIADFVSRYLSCQQVKAVETETFRHITPIANSSVEMGSYYHGFCL